VGPKGADEGDIYLTFTSEYQYPDIQPGSAEAERRRRDWITSARKGVRGTIDAIRRMAQDGQLDGWLH
jgi:hypothetical protein